MGDLATIFLERSHYLDELAIASGLAAAVVAVVEIPDAGLVEVAGFLDVGLVVNA